MENYRIKIELIDASAKVIARTIMTEEHARMVKKIYDVDVLLDTLEIMKGGLERAKETLASESELPGDAE